MPRHPILVEDKSITLRTDVGSFNLSWFGRDPTVQVMYYGHGSCIAVDREELITLLEKALEELKKND